MRQAQGENGEADEAIERAHAVARKGDAPPNLLLANALVQLQIALKRNDLALANRCYRTSLDIAPDGVASRGDLLINAGCLFSQSGILQARYLLAQGKHHDAAQLLAGCYESAACGGLPYDQINARIWQAKAMADQESGRVVLTEAINQAEPEGYVRSFIDAGEWIRPLLQDALASGVSPVYVARLLAAFDAEFEPAFVQPTTQPPSFVPQPLIEPLSDRELQIVTLLAERRSNAEIAQEITVSVNTVKTHLRHIYEKLGVHDRRTAVARARDLNLIS